MIWLISAGLVLAVVPLVIFLINLGRLRPLTRSVGASAAKVSVLIAARNEEETITSCLRNALRGQGVEVELLVMDDGSTDRTAELVEQFAAKEPRLRFLRSTPPPEGWSGKAHAYRQLAEAARHPVLVFVGADVRVRPDGLARLARFLEESGAAFVSGVPESEGRRLLEQLLLPLLQVLQMEWIPLGWMRSSRLPFLATGSNRLMVVRREAYLMTGGHAMIPGVLDEAVALPRVFRAAGCGTDLFDGAEAAGGRLHYSNGAVWRAMQRTAGGVCGGLGFLLVWSVVLLLGQVLPVVLMLGGLFSWFSVEPAVMRLAVAGAVAVYLARFLGMIRLRHPLVGVLFHPVGVLILVAARWVAFLKRFLGIRVGWKGRKYPLR